MIRKRIVLWGNEPEAKILPRHSGVVVSESALVARLRARIDSRIDCGRSSSERPDWSIHATSKVSGVSQKTFGSRMARAVPVQLNTSDAGRLLVNRSNPDGCSYSRAASGNGSLLAIGGPVGELLDQSRLVAPEVEEVVGPETEFAAYPRILDPLCGPGWLACGGGAMSFDPILRRRRRERRARSHLGLGGPTPSCRPRNSIGWLGSLFFTPSGRFSSPPGYLRAFYVSARRSDWWDAEIAPLLRGIEWTRDELSRLPAPHLSAGRFQFWNLNS